MNLEAQTIRAREADELARELVALLAEATSRARREGVYRPPPGRPRPRRRRQPGSLRHLAEVIRANGLCRGVAVDKDIVGAVLAGDPRYLVNPEVVVAVVRACGLIHDVAVTREQTDALVSRCARLAVLM